MKISEKYVPLYETFVFVLLGSLAGQFGSEVRHIQTVARYKISRYMYLYNGYGKRYYVGTLLTSTSFITNTTYYITQCYYQLTAIYIIRHSRHTSPCSLMSEPILQRYCMAGMYILSM